MGLGTSYGIRILELRNFSKRRDAGTVVFWSIVYFPLLAVSVCLVIAQVYARVRLVDHLQPTKSTGKWRRSRE
jgi:hypothetical protein